MLDEPPDWNALAARWADGRLKLAWTRRLLAFRNRHAAVFMHGDYAPLAVRGRHRDHVIAFARRHRGAVAIVVTLRHFVPFTDGGTRWPDWKHIDAAVDLGGTGTDRDIAEARWLVLNRSLQTIPALVIPGTVAPRPTKKPH
jgi:(1->4)-alpha-D-glucan 1-alpha-D-glucosylmutase